MIDVVRWALVLEAVGLAFLPLTVWALGRLPDRGYIFAKTLGMVGITYVVWLVGSFVPIGGNQVTPAVLVLLVAAVSWWRWRQQTIDLLNSCRRLIVLEEVLFLGALVVWSVLRAQVFHPAISHTEQFMDMALLGSSMHAASYPPVDPWMSGHGINYYYFGYLMFGLLTTLSGVGQAVGYNLALATLPALCLAGLFSLGYALTRRYLWALVPPVFVCLLGNWYAIATQLPNHKLPNSPGVTWWFFDSTRVIQTASDYTINEFPFFSFMLGDLHPHVMALPVTLLAIALGYALLLAPAQAARAARSNMLALLPAALVIGSLFTINSWDFPTYTLVAAACIGVHGYLSDPGSRWWRGPVVRIVVLGLSSVLLFTPFYLQFRSLAHGVGVVTTPTTMWQFLQVFGLFVLAAILLVSAVTLLLQPAGEQKVEEREPASLSTEGASLEWGQARASNAAQAAVAVALLVLVVIAARYHLWVLLLLLALGGATLVALRRVLLSEEPNRSDAMALVLLAIGCLVVALPEVLYVRDSFDGGASYRMNTMFKFYYQGWTLLGLAAGYATLRVWRILRDHFAPIFAWSAAAVLTAGALGGAAYTYYAPQSAIQDFGDRSLNGAQWLSSQHPGDYAAIRWLQQHVSGQPVELEATGAEYNEDQTDSARISTFTGLPTVMGWAGHEYQWRGNEPEIQTRVADVNTIYGTRSSARAAALLHQYHVRYVVVGDSERMCTKDRCFSPAALAKFGHFMRQAYRSGGTTIYTW